MENPSFICFSASSAPQHIENPLAKDKVITDSSEHCQQQPPAKLTRERPQGVMVFEANCKINVSHQPWHWELQLLCSHQRQMQLGAHRRVKRHNNNVLNTTTYVIRKTVQV